MWLPLSIYAATRLIAAVVISWTSGFQGSTAVLAKTDPLRSYFVHTPLPADPGYLGVATSWDGQWYSFIAVDGYRPASVDPSPEAGWAWAFPPGYPKSVSLLMRITGWEFPVAAVVLSLLLGAAAMVLLYRLTEPRVGPIGAAGVVALTCCFVSAPLFQIAYSESAAMLLVLCNLALLQKKSYWWALIPLVLLAFTRLITPPLGIVALFHVWIRVRKENESLSRREWLAVCLYVAISLIGVGFWSFVSGLLGGGLGASRASSMASGYSWGWVGAYFDVAPVMAPVLLVMMVLWGRIALSEWRTWGPEMSAWAAAYPAYVLLVTTPHTGVFRYFLLAFPLGLALVGRDIQTSRWRLPRIALACLVMLALQVLWVRYALIAPTSGFRFLP